jgi:hypothetical protein
MRWIVIFILCFSLACTRVAPSTETAEPTVQFGVGDCLKYTGANASSFPPKFIVAEVDSISYKVYDFQDKDLTAPSAIPFDMAKDFKRVQCNE